MSASSPARRSSGKWRSASVEISFASFADVVLPAKKKKNSFHPSKKTSQADL
jgi:hypothetical protein